VFSLASGRFSGVQGQEPKFANPPHFTRTVVPEAHGIHERHRNLACRASAPRQVVEATSAAREDRLRRHNHEWSMIREAGSSVGSGDNDPAPNSPVEWSLTINRSCRNDDANMRQIMRFACLLAARSTGASEYSMDGDSMCPSRLIVAISIVKQWRSPPLDVRTGRSGVLSGRNSMPVGDT
jgi:hypothetical protein